VKTSIVFAMSKQFRIKIISGLRSPRPYKERDNVARIK